MNFLRQVQQLELATGVAHGGETAHELSHAGTVDVVDGGQIQDDLLLAFRDEVADGSAKVADLIPEDDASIDVEDGNVTNFARSDIEWHDCFDQGPMAGMVVGAKVQVNGSSPNAA